ncbi:hypothetical protein PAXRUDRAFT_347689 [Paxillus rubicundulus Ve08.2h10]|uniref:Uncharacterized protein n=1 Tax=Paxillus rubicundulus Ve08.2h10 TaxID=930991 RepID=A0A0D0D3C1_9AGAM|nr:hypothetical protein PAXRUDRAFT_347689 [Paxillus rubicundulus Ve08.2h10]
MSSKASLQPRCLQYLCLTIPVTDSLLIDLRYCCRTPRTAGLSLSATSLAISVTPSSLSATWRFPRCPFELVTLCPLLGSHAGIAYKC